MLPIRGRIAGPAGPATDRRLYLATCRLLALNPSPLLLLLAS